MNKKRVEQLQKVLRLSKADSEALLIHAAEVDTVDDIPLKELTENALVDSTTETLNDLDDNNPSTILNRNAPRRSYE